MKLGVLSMLSGSSAFAVLVAAAGLMPAAPTARADGIPAADVVSVACPKSPPKAPAIARADVYKDVPFKAGESGVYEVTWGGAKVGYGTLEVRPPVMHLGSWHRVFHVDASTGDWFKAIFVAKEEMLAKSRPWDFGVSQFYMTQNEGKLFGRSFVQKKWLDFDHDHCKVTEKVEKPGEPEKTSQFDLSYGAIDALGVIYALRARTFTVGKVERAPVYTSEKNWWLEAEPVAVEKVEVGAGTFNAVKLKLTTFIGKELQQKGEVYAWIATDTPEKQLVQIKGDIKLGSVWIKLDKYKAGK
jgi:hypothetical protein